MICGELYGFKNGEPVPATMVSVCDINVKYDHIKGQPMVIPIYSQKPSDMYGALSDTAINRGIFDEVSGWNMLGEGLGTCNASNTKNTRTNEQIKEDFE